VRRIGVLTSGGDAPGMNAAIRAVARTAIGNGWEVYGIQHGFTGLYQDNMIPIKTRDVGGIIQQGGTWLGSARSREFMTEPGRRKALRTLHRNEIEVLVVIGGNGSQKGSYALSQMSFPVVGIASTIDNDLYGTDISLGVDTALDVALEAIDRIKVTASSHQRAFVIEVMGRDCGYLALMAGIAGGADSIVIPEIETDPEEIALEIQSGYERGKAHAIIVAAEGARYNAEGLERYFKKHRARLGFDIRTTILGYVQRGGNPGAWDRLLGTRFGAKATECIEREEYGVLVGLLNGEVTSTPLSEVVANKKTLDPDLIRLIKVLAY